MRRNLIALTSLAPALQKRARKNQKMEFVPAKTANAKVAKSMVMVMGNQNNT